ncbi:MAG: hypothetical protein ABW221_10810 [Vicinamibacteria bacterium]
MMDDLKVPTVSTQVQILCADGTRLAGTVFLPTATSHHEGPTRPEEWMNDGSPFFPFLPEGSAGALILNKDLLVAVTLAATPGMVLDVEREVQVEAAGEKLVGIIHIDLPANHQRVLDYLNLAPDFVPLYSGQSLHLLNKRHVSRLKEGRS